MNTDRIKEIQQDTAYPDSISVQQALLKVWNETEKTGEMHIKSTILEEMLMRAYCKQIGSDSTVGLGSCDNYKYWLKSLGN